jgi:hypothetical protein
MANIYVFILNISVPGGFWPHDLLSFLDSLSTWMAILHVVVKAVGVFNER